MGNNKSSGTIDVLRASRPGEWVKEGSTGYCEIVRSTLTGQTAEQYSVPVDGRLSQQDNIARYQYRSSNNPYIVAVYQVQKEDSQYICQGQEHIIVRTERIPQRLSEVGRVTTEEGLYILHQALQGFRVIYEFHGMTHINDDMICLTPEGRVRVWLNDNLAANLPDADNRAIHQNQMVMVDQLTDIVKQHIAGNAFPYRLREMMAQHPPNTFEEAIAQLQSYLQASRTNLPSGIRSIRINQNVQTSKPVENHQPPAQTVTTRPREIAVHQTKPPAQVKQVQQTQSHQVTSQQQQPRQIHSISTQQPQPVQTVQPAQVQQQPTVKPSQTYNFSTVPRAQTVHGKPSVIQPISSTKPSITINIPFTQYGQVGSSITSTSTSTAQSVHPQQQSQIVQRSPGSLANQQFVRQMGTYNKLTAVAPTQSNNSRLIKADTLTTGSQSNVIPNSMTQSVHHQLPQNASQVRMQVGVFNAANTKVEQSQPSSTYTQNTSQTITVTRNESMPLLQQQQPYQPARQLPNSGVVKTGDPNSPTKQSSLQSQIEKLKEVTKLVGVKTEPSTKVEAGKGASFVSPSTQTKTIKFEAQPIKEKQQIFVRAQPTSASKTGFQKKQSISQSEQPAGLGFIKSTRSLATNQPTVPNAVIEQQKYIPMQQATTTSSTNTNNNSVSKWTTPKQVTSMEPLKGNSIKSPSISNSSGVDKPKVITIKANVNINQRAEGNRQAEPAKPAAVMPSEIDELDALQNRLSEVVSKTKQLTEQSDQNGARR